jgi:hypothetical protein
MMASSMYRRGISSRIDAILKNQFLHVSLACRSLSLCLSLSPPLPQIKDEEVKSGRNGEREREREREGERETERERDAEERARACVFVCVREETVREQKKMMMGERERAPRQSRRPGRSPPSES